MYMYVCQQSTGYIFNPGPYFLMIFRTISGFLFFFLEIMIFDYLGHFPRVFLDFFRVISVCGQATGHTF